LSGKRTFTVRVNIDDMTAMLAGLDGQSEKADWLDGYMVGVHGHQSRESWSSAKMSGFEFGHMHAKEVESYREAQSERGQRSAEVRAARTGSSRPSRTDREPPFEPPFKPSANQSNNPTIQQSNNPRNQGEREQHPPDHSDLIPPKLKAMEFLNAWGEWLAYQAEKGYPVLRQQAKFTLLDLANNPGNPHKAAAWISASISKGLRTISEPFQASPGRAGVQIASSDDEIRAREIKRARNGLEAAKARGDKGMVKEMEEKLKKLGVS